MIDLFEPRIVVLVGPTIRHIDEIEIARRLEAQRASAANARAAKTPLTPERRALQKRAANQRFRDKQRAISNPSAP